MIRSFMEDALEASFLVAFLSAIAMIAQWKAGIVGGL
jgi:hypothetical protein